MSKEYVCPKCGGKAAPDAVDVYICYPCKTSFPPVTKEEYESNKQLTK